MADPFIPFNDQIPHGRRLRSFLNKLNEFMDESADWMATSEQMKQTNADGSDPAHWATLASKAGFESNEDAKSAFDEIASLKFKLTTNSSVSDVNAAILQCLAKFG